MDRRFIAGFWKKVDVAGPDECWLWKRSVKKGYGQLKYRNRYLSAHRVAFDIAHGGIPYGQHILHACDTPLCCNPKHLRAGSREDNMRDMYERRRWSAPWTAGTKKLTEDDVRVIRASPDVPKMQLARSFGVSARLIRDVLSRRSWPHVA